MITKEELMNTKVYLPHPRYSYKIQQIAFKLGFSWYGYNNKVRNTDKKYLFFNKEGITYSINEDYFNNHHHKELKYYDIIDKNESIKIEYDIGDKVKIIDEGRIFTTYDTWPDLNIINNWEPGNKGNNGQLGEIINIDLIEPNDSSDVLALVKLSDDSDIIINVKGLKLVKPVTLITATRLAERMVKNAMHGVMGHNVHRMFVPQSINKLTDYQQGVLNDFMLREKGCFGMLTYNQFKNKMEENKMELEDMKKENLEKGKELVIEAKMNAEVREATRQFEVLDNRKDELNREIKVRKDELIEIEKKLKIFDKKK